MSSEELRTKDQYLFSIVPRHSVSQLDLLPEVMNDRVFRESPVRKSGAPRSGDGENSNGFPLINREIDAVMVQVVSEDHDGWGVNSCV